MRLLFRRGAILLLLLIPTVGHGLTVLVNKEIPVIDQLLLIRLIYFFLLGIIVLTVVVNAIVYGYRWYRYRAMAEHVDEFDVPIVQPEPPALERPLFKVAIGSVLVVVLSIGYSWLTAGAVPNPCSPNALWQGTPCTNERSEPDERVVERLSSSASRGDRLSVRRPTVMSWLTEYGRIYVVGVQGTNGGMLEDVPPGAVSAGEGACWPVIQPGGDQGIYYNSHGEEIAFCSTDVDNVPLEGADPPICAWLESLSERPSDFGEGCGLSSQ